MMESSDGSEVTKMCLSFFETHMNKHVKMGSDKWTVFAAIVVHNNNSNQYKVLAAATGTKCVGHAELCSAGLKVHDSHAEILVVRAFRRALLHHFNQTLQRHRRRHQEQQGREQQEVGQEEAEQREQDDCSLFDVMEDSNGELVVSLRKELRLHFFSTHPPCGDASIFVQENEEPCSKVSRLDLNRTGAKCLPGEPEDENGPGLAYHTSLGALRRKPGRGSATKSVSCSDKMLKYNVLGYQGTLLTAILQKPIFMTSIIVCGGKANWSALHRALIARHNPSCRAPKSTVKIKIVADQRFKFEQISNKRPHDVSVVYNSCDMNFEAIVNGRKQGCVKKNFGTIKASVSVCRLRMAQEFMRFVNNWLDVGLKMKIMEELKVAHIYCDLKRIAAEKSGYEEEKMEFLRCFKAWPRRKDKFDCLDRFSIVAL